MHKTFHMSMWSIQIHPCEITHGSYQYARTGHLSHTSMCWYRRSSRYLDWYTVIAYFGFKTINVYGIYTFGIQLAGIALLWLADLTIDWDGLSRSLCRWEFSPLFRPLKAPAQSPNGRQIPVVRAVQGDYEIVSKIAQTSPPFHTTMVHPLTIVIQFRLIYHFILVQIEQK